MAETLRQRMVRGYAWSIYIDGKRTFAATATSYHVEIKEYAAETFTKEQIDNAYANGWITQAEYDDTLLIKYPDGYTPPVEPTEQFAEQGISPTTEEQ